MRGELSCSFHYISEHREVGGVIVKKGVFMLILLLNLAVSANQNNICCTVQRKNSVVQDEVARYELPLLDLPCLQI